MVRPLLKHEQDLDFGRTSANACCLRTWIGLGWPQEVEDD